MPTQCFGILKGKRVRVTELDDCGAPVPGGSFVVSDGFVTVTLGAELESGDEFVQKNADGALCINQRDPDLLKRLNVTINWCRVDPDIVSLITGSPVELDGGGDTVGFRIEEGRADTKWALELWTGIAGQLCGEDGFPFYGYILLPFVLGSSFGDLTIENAAVTFDTTGYTSGSSGWGVGPFEPIGTPDSPGPLDDAIGPLQHAVLRTVQVPPPDAECGAQTLPTS